MATSHDELLGALRTKLEGRNIPEPVGDVASVEQYQPQTLPAPASLEDVLAFERTVELALPTLYRRILLEVANGGFGPGLGFWGVPPRGYFSANWADDLAESYQGGRAGDPQHRDPHGILSICHWGGLQHSYIDCLSPQGRILTCDFNHGRNFHLTSDDFGEWLGKWIAGIDLGADMREPAPPREGINPFTREKMLFPRTRLKPPVVDLSSRV